MTCVLGHCGGEKASVCTAGSWVHIHLDSSLPAGSSLSGETNAVSVLVTQSPIRLCLSYYSSLASPQKCGSHISDRCSVSFTPFLDHLRNPAPRHYAGMHPRLRLNNTFHVYSHSSHILKRFMNRRSHILSEFRYKTFRNAQLCHQWAEATSWFSQDAVQQPPW